MLCRYCQRPLSLLEEKAGVCLAPACRQRAHQEAAGAKQRAHDAAVSELVQLGRTRQLVADPDSYPVIPIPAQHRPLGPASVERKQAFVRHLDALLAGVEGPARMGQVTHYTLPGEVERLSIQGCIGCRGACCQTGSTHAWLTVPDIQRIRASQGDLAPEQFRAQYLDRLDGSPRYIESCVFHGEKGCVLPREIRSERCNAHWCGELRQLQRSLREGRPARALLVWPTENGGVTGAYAGPDDARPIG